MKSSDLPHQVEKLLADTPWGQLGTSRGDATDLPSILTALFSDCEDRASSAAQCLNDLLCPGHNRLASAALPALPIILHALSLTKDHQGTEQILNILMGFSQACAAAYWEFGPPDYLGDLRLSLEESRGMLTSLIAHDRIDIAERAKVVLEHMDRAEVMYG